MTMKYEKGINMRKQLNESFTTATKEALKELADSFTAQTGRKIAFQENDNCISLIVLSPLGENIPVRPLSIELSVDRSLRMRMNFDNHDLELLNLETSLEKVVASLNQESSYVKWKMGPLRFESLECGIEIEIAENVFSHPSELSFSLFVILQSVIDDLMLISQVKKLTPVAIAISQDDLSEYESAFDILNRYDHSELVIKNVTKDNSKVKLDYNHVMSAIKNIPDYKQSSLFGREKDRSFEGILAAIYQSAFGSDIYQSIQEKAANLLYFIVKDHSFLDGNKRIAAMVFLWFLNINGILHKKDGTRLIENNALVAFVLMIAFSNPSEKDEIVRVLVNLIDTDN